MTTEEYVRQYMPGNIERAEDGARFDTIVKCVETGTPLPDGFESVLEAATASYIKARCTEMRAGTLPKIGYQKCVNDMRRRFLTEYRAFVLQMTRYKEILENGLKFSRECTRILKNADQMTDEEIIESFLSLFGVVFNEVEADIVRKKWRAGRKADTSREKKAKKPTKKKAAPIIEIPDELREAWDGFEKMRKTKRKPMTERAAKMVYKKLMELAGDDISVAEKILNESTRNGWTDVYTPKPEAKKQGAFSSDASYDLEAFEKTNIGLKFIEEG